MDITFSSSCMTALFS